MTPEQRDALERDIRSAADAGDLERAATLALRGYGPELLGFLSSLHGDPEVGTEVFQRFSLDMWRGLPAFRWGSSFRTWAYVLARNASHRYRRDPLRRRGRPLESDELVGVVDEVRQSTLLHLRTTMKDGVQRLRESLTPDDQALLILRIDRQLAWNEVATVMLADPDAGNDSPEPEPTAVRREAARLRKRFERVKHQLRELAVEQGLIAARDQDQGDR